MTRTELRAHKRKEWLPYRCDICGLEGHRLWRTYSSFGFDDIELQCAVCIEAYYVEHPAYASVRILDYAEGDQIGWWVPACLTAEGDTCWGYTSVPDDRILWWCAMPTFADPAREIAAVHTELTKVRKRLLWYQHADLARRAK